MFIKKKDNNTLDVNTILCICSVFISYLPEIQKERFLCPRHFQWGVKGGGGEGDI